jgi:hypothetical protein
MAYSLAPELYTLLPNSTDLTVFKEAGWPGLNFAFIKNGATHYHSPLDNLAELDERSVQHQGEYALALVRRFGALSLDDLRAPDAIYFNVFGSRLIVYSAQWSIPLAVLLTLLTAGLIVVGWRAHRLSLLGVGKGFAIVPLGLLGTLSGVTLVERLVGGPMRGKLDATIALLACCAVVIAVAFYTWCGTKVSGANLLAGGLLWWLLLLLLTSLFWPGASYLFTWPLPFGLLALRLAFSAAETKLLTFGRVLVSLLCIFVGGALFAPVVYLILIAFTLRSAGAMVVLAAPSALVLILLAPYFAQPSAASLRPSLR